MLVSKGSALYPGLCQSNLALVGTDQRESDRKRGTMCVILVCLQCREHNKSTALENLVTNGSANHEGTFTAASIYILKLRSMLHNYDLKELICFEWPLCNDHCTVRIQLLL